MSMEDFQQLGLLRDEEQWGSQRSHVRPGLMMLTVVVCLVACALMVIGDGGRLTAAGIVLFLIGLFALIGVNLRGIRTTDDGHEQKR